MKTYRMLIEYKVPNNAGTYYEEKFIQSRSSCGKIADDYLAQDRTNLIRSVEVTPVWLMMTYKELLQQLQQLNEDQLNSDVAVYDEGINEYYQLKVELVFATDQCDVLDVDHPIIRFWWCTQP